MRVFYKLLHYGILTSLVFIWFHLRNIAFIDTLFHFHSNSYFTPADRQRVPKFRPEETRSNAESACVDAERLERPESRQLGPKKDQWCQWKDSWAAKRRWGHV